MFALGFVWAAIAWSPASPLRIGKRIPASGAIAAGRAPHASSPYPSASTPPGTASTASVSRRSHAELGVFFVRRSRARSTTSSASSFRRTRQARCAIRSETSQPPSHARGSGRSLSTSSRSSRSCSCYPPVRSRASAGFIDSMKAVFTVYGGSVPDGAVVLSGAGAVLGARSPRSGFVLVLFANGSPGSWARAAPAPSPASTVPGPPR